MAHIVLDLPDPKPTLDTALTKQFTAIQQQLMGLIKSQQDATQTMRADLLATLRHQQEDLTDALEQLIKSVQQRPAMPDHADQLVGAVRELKGVVGRLAMPRMDAATVRPSVTVAPRVTVQLPPALMGRLDSLESSLLQGLRRSRSRTFGSNY